MAKVTIRFEDTDDGRVKTRVKFDPPIENDDTIATPAQAAAMAMLEAIHQHAEANP